jgi:hypothetical protein
MDARQEKKVIEDTKQKAESPRSADFSKPSFKALRTAVTQIHGTIFNKTKSKMGDYKKPPYNKPPRGR